MEFYLKKQNLIPYANGDKISIIGVPFDSTSIEFPGQRFGPKEIRETFSRLYGEDQKTNKNMYNLIEDLGDIEVVHGSFEETIKQVNGFIKKFKKQRNSIPIFLGGEHSITHATTKALKENFDIIVFDAHADCFETYAGEKYSHISYLNKIIKEKICEKACVLGVREYTKEEKTFMDKNNIIYQNPEKIDLKKVLKETKKKIYLSIDLDVLEFDIAIGTGTPEINGLKLQQLITHIKQILKEKDIIGIDIVEMNPLLEGFRTTAYAAAFLLKEIILNLK
jgi:agmatinase